MRAIFAVLVAATAFPLAGAIHPAAAATAEPTKCNFLQQLLGQCRKPATTTTTTTTTRPPTTTTTTTVASAACGGVATVPKAGGGVWTCDFSDEFTGTAINRSLWLPQTTKGSGFDSNDHDCFMDSPNNVP